jgi:GNAT superfamily N-acetyltransferase
MKKMEIRPVKPQDKDWIRNYINEQWYGEEVVAHGQIFYPADLPGFVAIEDGNYAGLITYNLDMDKCEIVTLNSVIPKRGIGKKLIEAVFEKARESNCGCVWLITTNDNLTAIEFYKKCGFKITAVHENAIETSRKLKPSIQYVAENGIPITDEIEFEYLIQD